MNGYQETIAEPAFVRATTKEIIRLETRVIELTGIIHVQQLQMERMHAALLREQARAERAEEILSCMQRDASRYFIETGEENTADNANSH